MSTLLLSETSPPRNHPQPRESHTHHTLGRTGPAPKNQDQEKRHKEGQPAPIKHKRQTQALQCTMCRLCIQAQREIEAMQCTINDVLRSTWSMSMHPAQTRNTKKKSMNRSKMPATESTSRLLLFRDSIVLSSAKCPWFTLSPASSTLSWTLCCGK